MKIEQIKLSTIEPYWRNPRINQQTVDVLMKSIVEYGFNVPITIDKDNVIITGHTRFKAVSNLQGTLDKRINELMEQGKHQLVENLQAINNGDVFVYRAIDLTPEQCQRYRLDDNKIGELSKWDEDILKAELRTIDSLIGFTDKELKKLSKELDSFEKYTDADIEKASKEMDEHFAIMVKKRADDLVDMICPYCSEQFSINLDELEGYRKWKTINDVKTDKAEAKAESNKI